MRIHILNVGHGDCIIVEFPSGRVGVIDINCSKQMDESSVADILYEGNPVGAAESLLYFKTGIYSYSDILEKAGYTIQLTDPVSYIHDICYPGKIFRFISTHPHMDHLTGLNALEKQVGFEHAWIQDNTYTQDLSRLTESQKEDWSLYSKLRDDQVENINIVRPTRGAEAKYWTDDGIYILAPPTAMLEESEKKSNANHMSYVLLIKYGQSKILLGGDAEESVWENIT